MASVLKPTTHQQSSSAEVLAEKILAYLRAYAQNAIQTQCPMDKSIHLARKGGMFNPLNYISDGRELRTWSVSPTLWYAVDQYGNGYEYGSDGFATRLTFSYLRRQPIPDLENVLGDFNPW